MNDNSSRTRSPGAGNSPLDEAIDRAVHDLMSVDPSPGLRRRVMSRLDAGAARRGFGLLQYGVMASAFAALILAVVLMMARQGPVQTGNNHTTLASQAPAATAPVRESTTTAPRSKETIPGRGARSRITSERIPMPRVANVFGSRPSGVSAATEPQVETVWPLPASATDNPPAVAPLVIAPLEIPALVVAPLAAPPKGGL
jgi:hypothetical protein